MGDAEELYALEAANPFGDGARITHGMEEAQKAGVLGEKLGGSSKELSYVKKIAGMEKFLINISFII